MVVANKAIDNPNSKEEEGLILKGVYEQVSTVH